MTILVFGFTTREDKSAYLFVVVESVCVCKVDPEPDLDLVLLHGVEQHCRGEPVLYRYLRKKSY